MRLPSDGQWPAQIPQAALPGPDEIAQLRAFSVELAREAGALVAGQRPRDLGVADTKSSATDVVTVMDQRSEDLLAQRLLEHRPHDGVLGEEGAGRASQSGLTWVVDPIDGTVNYLYGLPAWAVSVAVVLGDAATPGRWMPIAGAVICPPLGEVFSAGLQQGASVEVAGESLALRVSSEPDLGKALIATGFGYESPVRREQGRIVAGLLPQVRDIRRGGSAALDLCSVAAGRVDAYYERGVHAWDIAAGALIVHEAGGHVAGIGPGAAVADGVLAAGPGVRDALAGALADLATSSG